ncbi:hypothetical protein JTB14_022821 [Gonioctena quinquepunctata]|nr:hypothetical protein JTB14_022821 [Gonioctena quinquepunctata]
MNDEQLQKFCKIITDLKDKLKCTICLDVIKDTAELECGHKFCLDCYKEYKSSLKQATCPLCKAIVRRRSIIYKDEFADKLGSYVSRVCAIFKKAYDCDAEKMAQSSNADITRRSKLKCKSPTTSRSKIKNQSTAVSLNENAFDKLMKKPAGDMVVNKKGVKKMYSNRKKETDEEYEVLQFNDNENKSVVLKWLNDTRNKFERLTQTQTSFVDNDMCITDLVSVSQVRGRKSFPQQRTTGNYRPRARSLDIEVKKVDARERFADGSCIDVKENYTIEDADNEEENIMRRAEENILLNIIEDQLLDRIDSEFKDVTNNDPKQKIPPEESHTQPTTSGWERMGTITKTMGKRERVPKKLNITVNSSQMTNVTSEKKENIDSSTKTTKNAVLYHPFKKASPIKLKKHSIRCGNLDKSVPPFSRKTALSKMKNISINANQIDLTKRSTKMYDLNAVETYISKNIEVIEKNDSLENSNLSDSKNVSIEKDNGTNKENEQIIDNVPEMGGIVILENVILNNDNIDVCENEDIEEDPYSLPTQKLDISHELKLETDRIISDDNPFLILTQQLDTNSSNKHEEDIFLIPTQNCRDDISKNEVDPMDIDGFEENSESVQNILNDLLNNIRYCNSSNNIETVRDKLSNIYRYVEKLLVITADKIYGNSSSLVPVDEPAEKSTQTYLSRSNKQTQTEGEKINKEVQTECIEENYDLENPVLSKQIEESKCITQNTKKAMQTILLETQMSFSLPKQSERIATKTATQNNFFSATLDNFDFDTQDLTKDGTVKISREVQVEESPNVRKSPQGDTVEKGKEKKSANEQEAAIKENADKSQKLTNSLLVCTLNSGASNKVNRKLTYHKSTSSKRTLSDSDSDEVIVPKKLCNRFIRDDLSIEFDVNTETQKNDGTQKKTGKKDLSTDLLPDSDNVDYDGYLDKIMKKYKDNDCLISTPKKVDSQQEKKIDPKEDSNIEMRDERADLEDRRTDCNDIIAKVSENIKKLSKINDTTKSSYITASQNSVKSWQQDIDYGLKEIMDIDEHKPLEEENVRGQTESSDIIGETESPAPKPKRARREDFDVAFDQGEFTTTFPDLHGTRDEKNSGNIEEKDTVCQELNDSLDDEEFANIKITGEKPTRVDKHVTQEVIEEDLFSDDEDDDIVESTPQKNKDNFLLEKRSQRVNPCNISFPPTANPLESIDILDNLDFDFEPLLPPPDFQDTPQQNPKENTSSSFQVTVIENDRNPKESLTPDGLSQFRKKDERESLKGSKVVLDLFKDVGFLTSTPRKPPQLNISTNMTAHGMRMTQRRDSTSSCSNLSPIAGVKSVIEQAQTSSHTPLTNVSKQSSRKQNILTSTPKQKSIWNYLTSQGSQGEPAKSKPCIACSRVSKDKTQAISLLTNKKLATYSQVFDKSVTHMIVTVTENNCIRDYTMKFVAGVAAGIWILNFEWVQECLSSNSIVPEERYEVLDDTGMPGPRTARLTRKENPLFKGFKFFCASSFVSTPKSDIEDVIKILGGKPIPTLEHLRENDGHIGLIITEGRSTQDFEIYETWLETYKTVTVDIEWLSKSVGRYKLLSVRPYIWCSDDNLDDLGYPPYLTEMVQSSASDQF